jgi:hypothetical protein|tara:strand:- start:720 stop:1166 length:447 start_codon:yes stop_codon:yes gene_type:complete
MAYYLKTPGKVGNESPTKAVQIPVSTGAGDSPPVLQDGMLRYNSITNCIEFGINNAWRKVAKVGNATIAVQDTVGNGSITAFALDQLVADVTDIVVYVGGVYQQPTANYTVATNAGVTTLTFTSPPPSPGVNPNRIVILYNVNSTDAV